METGGRGGAPGPDGDDRADFLDSWKEIATYLQRDARTVMRWERTRALPIHRLPGGKKAAVYALKSELVAWRAAGHASDNGADRVAGKSERSQAPAPASALPGCEAAAVTSVDSRLPHVTSRLRATRLVLALLAVAIVTAVSAAILWLRPGSHAIAPPSSIRSIVVLPFDNLNQDPAHDYLADGVHDALITELARGASTSGLQVKSRASTLHYRGKGMAITDIARELTVDAVVEGTVLRAGDRVVVSAQLVRAANGDHMWANRYERRVGDVLDLVSELSRAIRTEIQVAVAEEPGAVARAASRPVRPDVLDTYLRARCAYHSLSREGLETAAALYQQALEIDPAFAPAWTGLALTRAAQAFISNAPPEVLPNARDAAQRALALDPSQAQATGVVSYVSLYWDWDFAHAGKALEEAVRLNPDSQMVRHAYADYLMVSGDVEGSLEQVRRLQRADPAAWPPRGIFLYHAHMARRYADVVREGRELARLFPTRPELHYRLAAALWLLGRRDEAIDEWAVSLGPGGEQTMRLMRQALGRGDAAGVLSCLAKDLARLAGKGTQGAVTVASLYAAAGDAPQAFTWLERSFASREPSLLHIVADPLFDPIRSDPRFITLLRRVGIP